MSTARDFAQYVFRTFDIDTTIFLGWMDISLTLLKFSEKGFKSVTKNFTFQGVEFERITFDFGNYYLIAYYRGNTLLFYVVDGDVCGYGVVNESEWDQENL